MHYGKYFVCTRINMLEWLKEKGHTPILTLPVEGYYDKWTYIFKNTPLLEWDANYYFRKHLWKVKETDN